VRRRAAREHGVDLGHVFGQSLIMRRFMLVAERALRFVKCLKRPRALSLSLQA